MVRRGSGVIYWTTGGDEDLGKAESVAITRLTVHQSFLSDI